MGEFYHTILQLCRGILKAPGDNFSAENEMMIIDLQDPNGISLQTQGWSPQLPSLKGGGTWAESNIADGRTPLSAVISNVTETMRLSMSNVDLQQRFAMFKKLGQMRLSVQEFWTGQAQIDPVYIRWFASIGKGEQYALIYNLDVAQDTDIFDTNTPWDITLTLEREPYWRGLWPGANPKEWTLGVVRGHARGSPLFDTDNMSLVADSDHFIYKTNWAVRSEWKAASVGAQTETWSENYIEIDGTQIPGDAPALLQLTINPNVNGDMGECYIALSTKEFTKTNHAGILKAQGYTIAGGDADTVASWTKSSVASSAGLRSNNSDTLYYHIQRTLAAVTTSTLTWGDTSSILKFSRDLLRGSFLVFARLGNTGAPGDQTCHIEFVEKENATNEYQATAVLPEITFVTSNTNRPQYMGRVTLPLSNRVDVSVKGYGRQIREGTDGNLIVKLVLTQTVVTSTTFTLKDIFLLPVDEGLYHVVADTSAGSTNVARVVLDNTHYLTHGWPDTRAVVYKTNELSSGVSAEVRGNDVQLIPGKTQRLYIQMSGLPSEGYPVFDITLTVRGNIIPRWTGIRDV